MLTALYHNALSLGGAAALIALGWLIGDGCLRRLNLPRMTRLEHVLLSVGAGLGLLSTVTFLVGVAGAFSPAGLRMVLLSGLAVGLALRRVDKRSEVEERPREPLPLWCRLVAVIAGLFLIGLLPTVLTPMVDPDGLAYHVGAPKRWIELGRITHLPTQLHTLWPMGEEMLNGLLLATIGYDACKPLIFGFATLAALATYALGARLGSSAAGAVAACVLFHRAGAPSINTTSVEIALSFYVILAALCLALRSSGTRPVEDRNALALSAAMAGFACATKLTGLLCLVFLGAAVVVLERRNGASLARTAAAAAGFAGGALILAFPWYLRTWWITGNPVFPFAYGLLGGSGWDLEGARQFALYFKTFDLPGEDVAQRAAFVQRHLLKLAVLTTAGLLLPGSPRWVRGFILAGGVYALVQVASADNHRFLLPPTAFAALALAWWAVRLAERFSGLGWVWAAGLAVLMVPKAFGGLASVPPVVLGLQHRTEFIDYYVNNRQAFEWANRNLPSDAKVLYGPDNRTYYLQRQVYWSSAIFQREISYARPEAFEASLRSLGIRWLILNRDVYKESSIAFEARIGWRAEERNRLAEAAERGKLRFSALGVEVYELP